MKVFHFFCEFIIAPGKDGLNLLTLIAPMKETFAVLLERNERIIGIRSGNINIISMKICYKMYEIRINASRGCLA